MNSKLLIDQQIARIKLLLDQPLIGQQQMVLQQHLKWHSFKDMELDRPDTH